MNPEDFNDVDNSAEFIKKVLEEEITTPLAAPLVERPADERVLSFTAPVSEERCQWCGELYGDHDEVDHPGRPVPKTPCLGLRENFVGRKL